MTPEMKEQLRQVIASIANENVDDAKNAFREYLRSKTQAVLVGEAADEEAADEDVKKDDEEEADDDEDVKKDDKKADKKADKKSDKTDEE